MKLYKTVLLSSLICFAATSHAATGVYDDFDAGLGTWMPNTTETTNTHQAAGGNPNGYLESDNIGVNPVIFHVVGAVNTSPNYSGVFADGQWTISVDLNFIRGDFDDAWLRFRFQDATANGWHIPLTNMFANSWNSHSVTFDTTWSDAQAMLNGWVKEADGATATPSFSGLWDDVYTSEVRLIGDLASSLNLVGGIDNYRATYVPVPAAVWLFSSGLVGLMALVRRKT